MARIRTIKPEFFTSETLAEVSIEARLTFIGLWTYVDDYGVGVLNEKLIVAALYPLDDDPSGALQRVARALRDLSSVGVLSLYVVKNRRYLRVANWEEHQTISHRSKPRFPACDSPGATVMSWEDMCQWHVNVPNSPESSGGLQSDAGGLPEDSPLNREQGTGNREQGNTHVLSELSTSAGAAACADGVAGGKIASSKAARRRTEGSPEFDEFWNIYPRKSGSKAKAWESWGKAINSGADPNSIVSAAAEHAEYHRTRGTDYDKIPHATTWLNQRRYENGNEQQDLLSWNATRQPPAGTRAQQRSENGRALVEMFAQEEYGPMPEDVWGEYVPGEVVKRELT